MTLSGSEAGDSCNGAAVAQRLKLLVAVHLGVGMVPGATFLVPPDLRFLPVIWAMTSLSVGQLMLLSFWAGMGTSKPVQRLFGTLCGVAYVGVWPTVAQFLSPYSKAPPPIIIEYLARCAVNSAAVLLFAGVFVLIRRWSTELRRVSHPEESAVPARFQYSILHVLVIMSVVAVVLGLARSGRAGDAPLTAWRLVAVCALVVVIFCVNSVCAAWAALGAGRIRLRVTLVLLVAIVLGIALSFAARHDLVAWWLLPSMMLVTVLPTTIVIASLLVVRSCGYRLTPKPIAVA